MSGTNNTDFLFFNSCFSRHGRYGRIRPGRRGKPSIEKRAKS